MDGIMDAIAQHVLDAKIAVVISNKKCPALEKAGKAGIPAMFLDPVGKTREEFDKEIDALLKKQGVDLVLLIGYMKILSGWFVNEWKHKVMNIHPSLLPEFAGGMDKDVHATVLASGVKKTGATLHFIDEGTDSGPIIMQKEVLIKEGETVDSLKVKVQEVEQELFVKAIDLFDKGKIKVEKNKVIIDE